MKHSFRQTGLAALAFAAVLAGCNTADQQPVQAVNNNQQEIPSTAKSGDVIPGSYIIVLRPDAGIQGNLGAVTGKVHAILTDHGISKSALAAIYETALQGFSVNISAENAGLLSKDPRVQFVEKDRVATLDPNEMVGVPEYGPRAQAQSTPWGITRVGGASNGTGKTAWVIDTGIDPNHADLTVNTTKSRNFSSGNSYTDGNGHGTHVAGTIAAKNNNNYVVGVAAGATVVAIRVLNNNGSGTTTSILNGINYVSNNAAANDVANMSLGFGGVVTSVDNAVTTLANKGVKIAIAAGNSGVHAGNVTPARVNHSNVYTVTAMNSSNAMASFSNYGNPPCDYAAPGVSVLSLWKSGGSNTISGTSMAAPHVAGILLLGAVATDGYITGDKDGTPDPIAHR